MKDRKLTSGLYQIEYFDKRRRRFYADYEPTKAARAISDFVQGKLATGTFVCVAVVSGKENMHKIKLLLIKLYIPVY